MKKELIIIFGIIVIIGIIYFLFNKSSNKNPIVKIAKQIKLDQLESVMEQLRNKNLEYDFFGITSNGIDCIYFLDKEGKINIDFEVMVNEQKIYVDKLKKFASDNGYQIIETTYGNKPKYDELKKAPVFKIEINADVKTATEIGKKIMTSIFNCTDTTKFDVVP
jgi:hypothetical protein